MTWQRVCREEEVPSVRGWPVVVGERRIAVFRLGDGMAAVDNVCLHTGAPLDDALVDHGCIRCPWHGWRYDLATGDHLTFFGHRPGLVTYPARVEDGEVWLDVPDAPGC